MTPKHTPAPWIVNELGIVVDANGDEVAAPAISAQLINAGANARLIAAAPDLAAALSKLVAGMNDAEDSTPRVKAAEVKAARAALTKAGVLRGSEA